MRNYSMIMVLALIVIVFAFITEGVNINPRNITNIFMQNSYILILAVGMMLVIILGNIDLSVGSLLGLTGAFSALIYNTGIGVIPTIALSIIIGILIGSFQAFFIAYLKIPAFIVTLAGMSGFRGVLYIVTNVTPISMKDDKFREIASGTANFDFLTINGFYFTAIAVGILLIILYIISEIFSRKNKERNNFEVTPTSMWLAKIALVSAFVIALSVEFAAYRGIPNVVIILAITIGIFVFITNNTILGRYIYATGGNARSAKLSGINTEQVVFLVHCIMGGMCGLAGVVFSAYMNSALPAGGKDFELDAIAACFIGGASTSGGIGTIIGGITGGLVMASINNGMSLMSVPQQWQYVVKASVLLLAVLYDTYTRRKSGLG
jgi:putative multiple sugar transport system permease protein